MTTSYHEKNVHSRHIRLSLEQVQETYNTAVLDFESGDMISASILFKACRNYCCNLLNNTVFYPDSYEMTLLIRFNALCIEMLSRCETDKTCHVVNDGNSQILEVGKDHKLGYSRAFVLCPLSSKEL